jgi:hypothetical protein
MTEIVKDIIPDPTDRNTFHVIKGSQKALDLILEAYYGYHTAKATLEITGRELADQKARGDRLELALAAANARLRALHSLEFTA